MIDRKRLRELAEETLVRHDALRVNLGDPVVITPSTTVLSLLDTIERYEKALQHYTCTASTINGHKILVYGDSGAIAREALNPKGNE